MGERRCYDCGVEPARSVLLDREGNVKGVVCDDCLEKRRRHRNGWRRRIRRRFRNLGRSV